MANNPNLRALYDKYDLQPSDMFPHQHYTIIKREGIEKIEAKAKLLVEYKLHACTETYCAFECTTTIEGKPPVTMFASAMNNPKVGKNCNTFYLLEMAQKRALARSVLKNCGFYTLGHYSEDEADDFAKSKPRQNQSKVEKPLTPTQQRNVVIVSMKEELKKAKETGDLNKATQIYEDAGDKEFLQVQDYYYQLFPEKTF